MKNFIFKSTDADLQKMFSFLNIIQKNVLYITHQVDYIRKEVRLLSHDKQLQEQVDKYFDEGEQSFPGLEKTSPQTDTDEQ